MQYGQTLGSRRGCKHAGWLVAVSFLMLVAGASAVSAQVEVPLGQAFDGSIDAVDDVYVATFFAAAGSTIRVTVEADSGTTLRPAVAVLDEQDSEIAGESESVGWLPFGNVRHFVEIPATGRYTVEISSTSGTGAFTALVDSVSGSGPDLATVSGTVTNALDDMPVADAQVFLGETLFATTDAAGQFTGPLIAGSFQVTVQADGFEEFTAALEAGSGANTFDVELTPLVPVELDASVSGDAVPGGSLVAMVDVLGPDNLTVTSVTWTRIEGVPVTIVPNARGTTAYTANVTLPAVGVYKDQLIERLSEPAVEADELPPNIPLPPGEFPAGLQDRDQVVGINPFAIETAGEVILQVEVETNLGTFHEEVDIVAALPWKPALGLRNVPVGLPVVLRAKESPSYDWNLVDQPTGSTATLTDADTRHPEFTPDVEGVYEIELNRPTRGLEPTVLQVYAGTWRGAIEDLDIDNEPVSPGCETCHRPEGLADGDQFTEWKSTGHANAFTDLLNTRSFFPERCYPCHAVGHDFDVDNEGMDDAEDYDDYIASGLAGSPDPDNFATMLVDHPEAGSKANIQCDNCHGPTESDAHGIAGPLEAPRNSLSSDVCAVCHGEPLRHGRFQQWQLSGHANYEVAIDESQRGSCARCHTANGFLAWLPILNGDVEGDPLDDVEVAWTEDQTHPQTCVTCHDPHSPGTTSGNDTDATVRISGDTPPLIAGFTATDIGRGAICMTCHNSRRGLRNDDVFDGLSASDLTRAPHGSAQTDVLMGHNAYYVEVGVRGVHALGTDDDSCVNCHMEATPPPDILSYNQSGANHTFYAQTSICSECHSPNLRPSDVQNGVESLLLQVEDLIINNLLALMGSLIDQGFRIDLGDVIISDVNQIQSVTLGETRGRQGYAFETTLGSVGLTGVNGFDVIDAQGDEVDELYAFASEALIKAGWNYWLVQNDGSMGIHNPEFVTSALISSRDALVADSGRQMAPRNERWRNNRLWEPMGKPSNTRRSISELP